MSKLTKTGSPAKGNTASAQAAAAAGTVHLADLPDPEGLYALIDNADSIVVEAPNVLDRTGRVIHPKDYGDMPEHGSCHGRD